MNLHEQVLHVPGVEPEDASAPAGPVPEDEPRRRGLVIGKLGLLVDEGLGNELLPEAQPSPLPRTRPWCRGLINLRGQLLPAFDLHEYLGFAVPAAPSRRWWLALRGKPPGFALAVDALPPAITVGAAMPSEVRPALPDGLRDCVGDAYRIGAQIWIELRHEALFDRLAADATL